MSTPRTISFGFLLIPFQAIDAIGPMDVVQNTTEYMVSALGTPDEAKRLSAPKINFHWIGPTMEAVLTSGNMRITPTCTVADCPKLDYLLIGGPAPNYIKTMPIEMRDFIVNRAKEVEVIFTTCTGGLVLAATGLLDDLEATTNYLLLPEVGAAFGPKVKWTKDKHWVIAESKKSHVKFWTAAGAGAGMDMMAQWVRETFGQELLNYSTRALEWQPRDIDGNWMKHMDGRDEIVVGSESKL